MYGLPDDFDGSELVGRKLEQVSFAAYSLYLSFGEDVLLSVMSRFAHEDGELLLSEGQDEWPLMSSTLMRLVGESITSVKAASDGALTLVFANGQSFSCFDDTPMYEAYHLRIGDKTLIV